MQAQEITKIQPSEDEKAKMEILLAMHCAPLLKGSKVANVLTVERKEFEKVGILLEGTGISYSFLKTRGGKEILYLYRKKELEVYLKQEEIGRFLEAYGYGMEDTEGCLKKLSERICLFASGEASFPHEIGIFLGYPLMDVKGFIENKGRNYIHSGYWKVYYNARETKCLFLKYDREREEALSEVRLGKSIREIVFPML